MPRISRIIRSIVLSFLFMAASQVLSVLEVTSYLAASCGELTPRPDRVGIKKRRGSLCVLDFFFDLVFNL